MLNPKLLWGGSIKPSNINIQIESSNRKTNEEIESLVSSRWEEISKRAKEKGLFLYDGTSFRLNSFSYNEEKGLLNLVVSEIKYSIRRSLVEIREKIASYGEDYYCKGLAIGGLVRTKDDKYVFGVRSEKTISDNKIDTIGGILEGIQLRDGNDLIQKNKLELIEELAINSVDIKDIEILGLVQSNTTNIILLTNTSLLLTSEELLEKFNNSDQEMSSLDFVDKDSLEKYLLNLGGYKTVVVALLRKLNILT